MDSSKRVVGIADSDVDPQRADEAPTLRGKEESVQGGGGGSAEEVLWVRGHEARYLFDKVEDVFCSHIWSKKICEGFVLWIQTTCSSACGRESRRGTGRRREGGRGNRPKVSSCAVCTEEGREMSLTQPRQSMRVNRS
jgi:hypothetical protein